MLWTEKYAPKSLASFCGNASGVQRVKTWALDWERGKPGKPLVISGPPGTGKSALVRALAAEMGWEIVEINSSESRTKGDVERVIGSAASSQSLFGGRKLIFIDDADAISGRDDRGGMGAIAEVLKTARNPVIATAGDYWDQRLKNLRYHWEQVELKKVNVDSITSLLSRILESEGIDASRDAAARISGASKGDIRSAINDLQALAEGKKSVTVAEADAFASIYARDREQKIREAIGSIMHATRYEDALKASWSIGEDPDMVKLWVDYVIPLEYLEKGDLARAFNWLSRADIFAGRIKARQYWGYLRYATALATAGVALSKDRQYHHFAKYGFPTYLSKMSASKFSRAKKKEIGRKIGEKCHCSTREASFIYVPLIRLLLGEKEHAKQTAEHFGFDSEEVAFILGKSEAQAKKLLSEEKAAAEKPKKARKRKAEGVAKL